MMEISTKLPAIFARRCHALNVAAYAVRQQATRSGGDFDTWRLSRLMREAETDACRAQIRRLATNLAP
jgi:hypothetical protein